MPTSLAAQLAQIAANSRSTLDTKAQRVAHSKSLIFEPKIAASQSFQTLYPICYEAFEELCALDRRFKIFATTLYSEQSQNEDRALMTAAENRQLDLQIEACLRLIGPRVRLAPAVQALEWLVRRFRYCGFPFSPWLVVWQPANPWTSIEYTNSTPRSS
jgi:U3 small nucleolar RNA-associated protein 10